MKFLFQRFFFLWPYLLYCSIGSFLGGCKPFSFLSVPVQNRGAKGFYHDVRLRLRINNFLLAEKEWSQCDLVIYDGRLMMVGFVKTKDAYDRIVDFSSKLPGIKKFTNHLSWGDNSQKTYGKDILLTRRFESALFFDSKINSQNFSVLVFNRIAYIVGNAKNEDEKNRVLRHANSMAIRKIEEDIQIQSKNSLNNLSQYSEKNPEKIQEKNWQQDEKFDDLYSS